MTKLVLVSTFCLLGFLLGISPALAQTDGTFIFETDKTQYAPGEDCVIRVVLNTGTHYVGVLQVRANFSSQLEITADKIVINKDATSGWPDPAPEVPTVQANLFKFAAGKFGQGQKGTAVPVATITAKVKADATGTATVTFVPGDDFDNSTMALDSSTYENIVGTFTDLSVTIGGEKNRWDFTNDSEGWTVTGAVTPFDLPEATATGGFLNLTSSSSNTFGFWYLDGAVASPTADTLYRARYAIKSDQTYLPNVPTFRIRYNAANFAQGDFVQVNSNDTGDASPGTTAKIYDLYFRPQYDAVGVNGTLSFDMINIGNPTDATIATLSLDYLQLDKKAMDDLGTTTPVKLYTFTADEENWSFRGDLGSFTPPNHTWDGTEEALTLESTDNTNTFGYWQNNQEDVAIDHTVLYQLRVKVAFDTAVAKSSAATSQPTMRARMYDHPTNHVNSCFQIPVWKAYEQPQSSPTKATQLTYKNYYAYFNNLEGVGPSLGIAIDMINLDPNAPAVAKIIISEVELSTFAIPTF
jgi:hypothetical protein